MLKDKVKDDYDFAVGPELVRTQQHEWLGVGPEWPGTTRTTAWCAFLICRYRSSGDAVHDFQNNYGGRPPPRCSDAPGLDCTPVIEVHILAA